MAYKLVKMTIKSKCIRPPVYDLAGFALGIAERAHILPRTDLIRAGNVLIGLPSSGVHSNGFSLVHAVMKPLAALFAKRWIKAFAHITGGGLTENVPRVLPKELAVLLDARLFTIPPVFAWLAAEGNVVPAEMLRTFNCGLGLVLVNAAYALKVLQLLQYRERATKVGVVEQRATPQSPQVLVEQFGGALHHVQQLLRTPRKQVAVLISGSGTNLQALIDASRDSAQGRHSDIVLVISNKADVLGVERARRAGIATVVVSHKDFKSRDDFDAERSKHLLAAGVDLVCLAGFMRVLSEQFVRQWKGRLVNIHPSLLPKHPGLHVQKKALEAGDTESGCTVHFVDEGVDTGAIIVQSSVPILAGDTEEKLTKRIQVAEHFAFPKALRLLATGAVKLSKEGKTVFV